MQTSPNDFQDSEFPFGYVLFDEDIEHKIESLQEELKNTKQELVKKTNEFNTEKIAHSREMKVLEEILNEQENECSELIAKLEDTNRKYERLEKTLEDERTETYMLRHRSYVQYVDETSTKNKCLDHYAGIALEQGGNIFGGYVRDRILSELQKKPKNVKDLDVMFYDENKFIDFIKAIQGDFLPVYSTNYSLHCNEAKIKFKIDTVEKSIVFVLIFETMRPSKRITRFLLELCIKKTILTEFVSLEWVENTYIIKYKYTNTKDPQESDIDRSLAVSVFENYPNMICVKFIHKYVVDAALDIVYQPAGILLPIFSVNNLMLTKEGGENPLDDILNSSTMRCQDIHTNKQGVIDDIENKRLELHGSIYKMVSEIPDTDDTYYIQQYIKRNLIPWFDRLLHRYRKMRCKGYSHIKIIDDVQHHKIRITEFEGLEKHSVYYDRYLLYNKFPDDCVSMPFIKFLENTYP